MGRLKLVASIFLNNKFLLILLMLPILVFGAQLVDNILIKGNTISSVTGNIVLDPAGSVELPDLTANRVLILNTDKHLTTSPVSDTTLGYLDVSSSLTTLLGAKADLVTPDFTGPVDMDNISISGNTISSNNTDGNVNVTMNGDGDFTVDTNTIYVDASANQVGIGTTPSYKLHVSDTAQINANTSAYALRLYDSGGNSALSIAFADILGINGEIQYNSLSEYLGLAIEGSIAQYQFYDDNFLLKGGNEIRLEDDSGGEYIGLKAPSSVTSSTTFTLPDGDGLAGNVLVTDGAGTLGWESVSGGASFVKWIENYDGEFDTEGWSVGGDGIAFTRTTSAGEVYAGTGSFKLSKAAEDIFEADVSYLFAIDPGVSETSKKINLSVAIKTSANYTSGELVIYVIDAVNVDILPCMNDTDGAIPASPTFSIFQCSFYTVPGVELYSLNFYTNSDNALAWDAFFELTYFSDGSVMPVPIEIGWTEYEMDVLGVTADPTRATSPDYEKAEWSRSGKNIRLRYSYRQSSSTGAASGTGFYLFQPPDNVEIDLPETSLVPDIQVGTCTWLAGSTDYTGGLFWYDNGSKSGFICRGIPESGGAATNLGAASGYATEATWRFTMTTDPIPVEGWDSGAPISTVEENNKSIFFSATRSTTQSVSTTSATVVEFDSINYNSHPDAWNAVTYTYTMPEAASCIINFVLNSTSLSDEYFSARILVNNSTAHPGGTTRNRTGAANPTVHFPHGGHFNKGDEIKFEGASASDNSYDFGASTFVTIACIPNIKSWSSYLSRDILRATSAEKSGVAGTNAFLQMTGNSVTLPPGSWALYGSIRFSNSGDVTYNYGNGHWATENGDDTTGGVTLFDPSTLNADNTAGNKTTNSDHNIYTTMPTAHILNLTEPLTVYLVPRAHATTQANMRVTTYIFARRLQ